MSEVRDILNKELGSAFGLHACREPECLKAFYDKNEVMRIIDWLFVRRYFGEAKVVDGQERRKWTIHVQLDDGWWGLGPAGSAPS